MTNVDQQTLARLVIHRFRACSPEHRDRYHADCDACLLIESNVAGCSNPAHVDGRCPICDLFDGRLQDVSPREEIRLVERVRNLFSQRK